MIKKGDSKGKNERSLEDVAAVVLSTNHPAPRVWDRWRYCASAFLLTRSHFIIVNVTCVGFNSENRHATMKLQYSALSSPKFLILVINVAGRGGQPEMLQSHSASAVWTMNATNSNKLQKKTTLLHPSLLGPHHQSLSSSKPLRIKELKCGRQNRFFLFDNEKNAGKRARPWAVSVRWGRTGSP